ncbi:MAG TPA: CotH kinase family protein [Haliangium sp.]|nr:CotH kinase family protein [Haliangium sp.]
MAGLIGSAVGCSGQAASPEGERVSKREWDIASEREDESDRVFDTTVLHEINIEVAPEYLDALEDDREQRVPCTFTFDGLQLENVGIRLKGRGSQNGDLDDRPSFSIKFNEFVRGQKLYGLNKLILNNAAMDSTLLDEHLGYFVYQRAGVPSRRSAHAVVTLSGFPSYGVYVMVEAVNKKLMTRHFGPEQDGGNLFEAEAKRDFAADPLELELKDPEDPGRSYDRLVEFAGFLNDASDDELVDRLDEFIDLDKALASFAVDLLVEHGDGFWLNSHNYYLYQHPADDRFVLLPHGMDLLFEPDGPVMCGMVPEPDVLETLLGARISAHPELRARMEEKVNRVLAEAWDVALVNERIDALTTLLERSEHDEPAFEEQREKYFESLDALKHLVGDVEEVWRGSSTCGDGERTGNELCASMCDDGNQSDGDGCSSQCRVEHEEDDQYDRSELTLRLPSEGA